MTPELKKHIETLIEVQFDAPDKFSVVRETLERIGVPNFKEKKLYQTCHIFHKKDEEGKSHYYLLHFKEMFPFDGKESKMTEEDYARRDGIALMLEDWGLIEILNPEVIDEENATDDIFVLKYHQRKGKVDDNGREGEWETVPKYNIGKPKYRKRRKKG